VVLAVVNVVQIYRRKLSIDCYKALPTVVALMDLKTAKG